MLEALVEPSAWIRSIRLASRRLQNFARSTFPPAPIVKSPVVRVIATRRSRFRRTARSFKPICRTTAASPEAPPPSLIFRYVEPGPIGSVSRFAPFAEWPGSMQTSGAGGATEIARGGGGARAIARMASASILEW